MSISIGDGIMIVAFSLICFLITAFSDVPELGIVIMLAYVWITLTKILTQMEKTNE